MKFIPILFMIVATSSSSFISEFVINAKSFWPKLKDLSVDSEVKKLPHVVFELPTENEKFLEEGLKLIDAPREALDVCTHRVIQTLKTNCNQLNLEDIGKLAVMMLNCQLDIEGRSTYQCKPEMTLKQCTMGMNEEMYKIYNYMTHRVVGVCSVLKQDQFRALSELTINRLMEAAQSQVLSMNEALKNQKRMNEMGIENLKEYTESDGKIRESQAESLEKLKQAGSIIEEIEKSADVIGQKLAQHTLELNEEHDKLLKEVDEITINLQKNNQDLIVQYNQALESLNNFKSVMLVLSKIATKLKMYIDRVMETIHEVGFDLPDEFIAVIFVNIVYGTCSMVFILFINAQGKCKFLLMSLLVFNTVAACYRAEISLFPINILAWFTFAVLKVLSMFKQHLSFNKVNVIRYFQFQKGNQPNFMNGSDESDSEDDREPTPLLVRTKTERNSDRIIPAATARVPVTSARMTPIPTISSPLTQQNSNEDDSEMAGIFTRSSSVRPQTPTVVNRPLTPAMRRILSESVPNMADRSAAGTPFEAGMSGRQQCIGTTLKGMQCRNAAVPGFNKCRVHRG